jgi:hypothetical protein
VKFLTDAHINPANLAFFRDNERQLAIIQAGEEREEAAPAAPMLQQQRPPATRAAQQGPGAATALSPHEEAALDELSPRYAMEFELIQGWYRDRTALYYDFGAVSAPVTAARVIWPIHGFDARGNPVAMRGQLPIFSTIPGVAGYTGLWRITYLVTADLAQPNTIRDMRSVDDFVRRRRGRMVETNEVYNLPIVPRGSRLARDSTSGLAGWYQGREIQFFDFGAVDTVAAPMSRFVRGQDASGEPMLLAEQNSILDTLPLAQPFPDIWTIRFVRPDSAYVPNTIKSATALSSSGIPADPPHTMRNLPVVIVDGVRVTRATSPLHTFADMRSPFPPAPTRPQR